MIKNLFWTRATLLLLLILLVNNIALAQNNLAKQNIELRSPVQENFEKDEQLVRPWVSSICLTWAKEINPPNCIPTTITPEIRAAIASSLTLYNRDGTVWYNFNLNTPNPKHFLKNKKEDFLPFSTDFDDEGITLRMVAESPTWYEVEVNEATQTTKFILKSDPLWMKVSWNYFLATIRVLSFDEENKPRLYDKPNGKVIEDTSEVIFSDLNFRYKIEGEWAFVEDYIPPKHYFGWVRWRKGREMLFESKFFREKFNKPILND